MDLDSAPFRLGEAEGRWRLIKAVWPHAYVAVVAADRREFVLRLDCAGYPVEPPTGGLWDLGGDSVLAAEEFPRGKGGRVTDVFRTDWEEGRALYLPCDRTAIESHSNWRNEMPAKVWRPEAGIIQYLETVHELLHCRDYSAPLGAEA